MIGVQNRLPGARICEVGTCYFAAAHTENVNVIPGDPALRDKRHNVDIVLCAFHDDHFHRDGLVGVVTAYGDQIVSDAAQQPVGASLAAY